MLAALSVCADVSTDEPTRSSPSLMGGSSVSVIFSILLTLSALAKSSGEKLTALPFRADFAIRFCSAIEFRAGEMGWPDPFADEQETRIGMHNSRASKNIPKEKFFFFSMLFVSGGIL